MASDSDDEVATPELTAEMGLSADTLAALQAHLASKAQGRDWGEGDVDADFGKSQFWYTHETSCGLLREALAHFEGDDGVVAVLSAPSLMAAVAEMEGGVHKSKVSKRVGDVGCIYVCDNLKVSCRLTNRSNIPNHPGSHFRDRRALRGQ